jgi:hypothetical protein
VLLLVDVSVNSAGILADPGGRVDLFFRVSGPLDEGGMFCVGLVFYDFHWGTRLQSKVEGLLVVKERLVDCDQVVDVVDGAVKHGKEALAFSV